ncbi:LacI family transcriptional regulator [Marinithermofilum abyssi]|uniref:LacI family transcriptional regulator n=1 Tax=Marinithermofilum abyssi TaxID=1571185 RepID=A0A8J2YEN8_9BACL|nr:LacI family DNA-binding transcriptional regulator [Marinithermofilum abyssi]GGE26018.1 LacI family transcriptional regulator [Marinithermofilum abyssi]
MVTIKDVAKKADVSVATVSRVINGLGGVRPATEERIRKAVEELNYLPNVIARSMVMKRTETIGVIVPDIANPFFPEVIKGIEEQARDSGYTLFLANTDESVEKERQLLHALRERRVDGLIVTTADEQHSPLMDLELGGLPVVLVDRHIQDSPYDSVVIDNVDGAYTAIKHLVTTGHTKIGLIAGPDHVTPGRERTEGYVQALRDFEIPARDQYMKEGDFKEESGYQLGKELLSLSDPPTAIFSANNLMTLGLLTCIRDQGRELGKDIVVVGFDDLDIATFVDPPLTVVSRPMRQMGEIAADMLVERIQGKTFPEPRKVILIPRLIVRSPDRVE